MAKIKLTVFHRACWAVIDSPHADLYTKAFAQVGVGTWHIKAVPIVADALARNVTWQGASDLRCTFRRYAS